LYAFSFTLVVVGGVLTVCTYCPFQSWNRVTGSAV